MYAWFFLFNKQHISYVYDYASLFFWLCYSFYAVSVLFIDRCSFVVTHDAIVHPIIKHNTQQHTQTQGINHILSTTTQHTKATYTNTRYHTFSQRQTILTIHNHAGCDRSSRRHHAGAARHGGGAGRGGRRAGRHSITMIITIIIIIIIIQYYHYYCYYILLLLLLLSLLLLRNISSISFLCYCVLSFLSLLLIIIIIIDYYYYDYWRPARCGRW